MSFSHVSHFSHNNEINIYATRSTVSKMSSFHLFDPNKSVRFVKASQASDLSTQNANDKQLNGNEIRKFYEDLISQPSTSTTPIIKKVKGNF